MNILQELEGKFFASLKELDTKDCNISDLEDREKELKADMKEKNKEIEKKEQMIADLHEQISSLEKQIVDLEHDLEGERKQVMC